MLYNEYTHHEAHAFVDKIDGSGVHERLVSPSTSIWLRANTIEEGGEAPESMAEWSVFFTILGCVVLFKLIVWYRDFLYRRAIRDLKQKQQEMSTDQDTKDQDDEE